MLFCVVSCCVHSIHEPTQCGELKAQIEEVEHLLTNAQLDKARADETKKTIDRFNKSWERQIDALNTEINKLRNVLRTMRADVESVMCYHQKTDIDLSFAAHNMYKRLYQLVVQETTGVYGPADMEKINDMEEFLKRIESDKMARRAGIAKHMAEMAEKDKLEPQQVKAKPRKGAHMCLGSLTDVACHKNARCTTRFLHIYKFILLPVSPSSCRYLLHLVRVMHCSGLTTDRPVLPYHGI